MRSREGLASFARAAGKAALAGKSLQSYLLGELTSVAVTALTEPGSPAADLLAETDAVFQVPSIFDVEALGALRGLVRGGKYDRAAALDLIADVVVPPIERWHRSALLPRICITAAPALHREIRIIK